MDSFKVVLIGGPSCGKSAIFRRYTMGDFSENSKATINASFNEKTVQLQGTGKSIKIQLWDTAGSERFRTVNQIYYRNAGAALVVYDITRADTLHQEAAEWIKDLRANAPEHLTIALAGNKSDMYQ